MDDDAVVSAINHRYGAGLTVTGRSHLGRLGGAIFVEWPDEEPAVVTRFLGSLTEAQHAASILNHLQGKGLPVPRHQLVVELDDGVVFVQQRLRASTPHRLTSARIDALVEINERFADALADKPEVAPALGWCSGDVHRRCEHIAMHGPRARWIAGDVLRIIMQGPREIGRDADLVHVDLSPANVLFDETDTAFAVVDWNLGVYRGDRHFALVQTRFDREWFVQSGNADPVETAAARHLDDALTEMLPSDTLQFYWAHWFIHHLSKAVRNNYPPHVIDWQLEMAERRLM